MDNAPTSLGLGMIYVCSLLLGCFIVAGCFALVERWHDSPRKQAKLQAALLRTAKQKGKRRGSDDIFIA
jgi:hypothetical protein